jgi:hypothetical protein
MESQTRGPGRKPHEVRQVCTVGVWVWGYGSLEHWGRHRQEFVTDLDNNSTWYSYQIISYYNLVLPLSHIINTTGPLD